MQLLPVLQRVSAVSAEAAAGSRRPGTAAQLATLLSPLLLRRRISEPPRRYNVVGLHSPVRTTPAFLRRSFGLRMKGSTSGSVVGVSG